MTDLRRLWLGRFCNFTWWVMVRNLENQAEVDRTRAKLWMPPKGVQPTRGPWSPEAEMNALHSLKKSLGQ